MRRRACSRRRGSMRSSGRVLGGCWPVALEAEVDAYIAAHAGERDERDDGWLCATGMPSRARSRPVPGRSRSKRRSVDDKPVDADMGRGSGSGTRSCRRGAARARRWPRCCRSCACTACPAATLVPALEEFFGSTAGLSISVVVRLTRQRQVEATRSCDGTPARSTTCTCGSYATLSVWRDQTALDAFARAHPHDHPAGRCAGAADGRDQVRAVDRLGQRWTPLVEGDTRAADVSRRTRARQSDSQHDASDPTPGLRRRHQRSTVTDRRAAVRITARAVGITDSLVSRRLASGCNEMAEPCDLRRSGGAQYRRPVRHSLAVDTCRAKMPGTGQPLDDSCVRRTVRWIWAYCSRTLKTRSV